MLLQPAIASDPEQLDQRPENTIQMQTNLSQGGKLSQASLAPYWNAPEVIGRLQAAHLYWQKMMPPAPFSTNTTGSLKEV